MEKFQTSIFVKRKEKGAKRLLYNLGIFGLIIGIWILYIIEFPFAGLYTAITFSIAMLGIKIYDDKYMGISAYGDRKATLVITEQYLEIRGVRIPFTELTNLVIYVDEYSGMPKEFFGSYHGGNNKIEFERDGKRFSINYIIKNRQDFDRVSRLVDGIEKNPNLKKYIIKL